MMRVDPTGMVDLGFWVIGVALVVGVFALFAYAGNDVLLSDVQGFLANGYLKNELFMLAAVIYGEGGNECDALELYAIALTIRNRVNSNDPYNFPEDTYEGIIKRKNAYQAYEHSNGHYKRAMNYLTGKTIYSGQRDPNATEKGNMLKCLAVAIVVYYNGIPDITGGCVFYNGDGWNPGAGFVRWEQPSDWVHKYWYKPA